jgi:CRISPR-associated protein Csm5
VNSHLESYRVQLNTLSPVFIGSGKKITKKEYIYFKKGNRVIVPEFHKLFQLLDKKGMIDEYILFMESRQNDLYYWLRSKNISLPEVERIKEYELDAGDAIIPGKSFRGLWLFVKDNFGNLYIPGSSLKGAIRTALLAKMAHDNPQKSRNHLKELADSLNQVNRYKRGHFNADAARIESEHIHSLSFNNNRREMVNSVMRGIQVSDSRPVSTDNLIVCSKIDVDTSGSETALPTFRECIKPRTPISFTITLDNNMLSTVGITLEYIRDAIKLFSQLQYKYYISKFSLPPNFDETEANNGMELFIGGGAGFVSKTIIYPIGRENALAFTGKLLNKLFYRHKHLRDITYGVSPRMLKCTKYRGKLFMFGKSEVEFLEL